MMSVGRKSAAAVHMVEPSPKRTFAAPPQHVGPSMVRGELSEEVVPSASVTVAAMSVSLIVPHVTLFHAASLTDKL